MASNRPKFRCLHLAAAVGDRLVVTGDVCFAVALHAIRVIANVYLCHAVTRGRDGDDPGG